MISSFYGWCQGLKQTHKKLLDDERRIDKEQKMTDGEIQQFQTDKQRKLNQAAPKPFRK